MSRDTIDTMLDTCDTIEHVAIYVGAYLGAVIAATVLLPIWLPLRLLRR